ncbi:MAG: PorP/SprF family type IX secretion system membrane protein [Bacteroidaceae bacterium]|nr:PorP/SprF family type IX secretion system membrane protein [Bacteroidaceae bacterium]
MDIRKTILTLCAVLSAVVARAQFDTHFTHYWALQGYYNPASAGLSGRLNIYGTYAMQMAGYTNAPATMLIGADMVLPTERKNHAVSANLYNESIGLFTNQRLFAGYSYRFKLGRGRMAVGVNMGSLEQKFDGSKVEAEESTDAAFPSSEVDGMGFDLTAGVHYAHRLFYAGLAMMHVTAPTIELGETHEIKVDPTYYFSGGCNIQLKNPLLSIQPSMQVMTDLQAWRADLTVRGTYTYDEKRYYVGLTYSPMTSVAILLGGEINSVSFGYAYELFTSGVGLIHGSHDLYVGYVMDLDLFKKGRNKHKSIRIL